MKAVNPFALYHDLERGTIISAAQCRKTRLKNPANYVYLGRWQVTQRFTLPYYRDGAYYRFLHGNEKVFTPPSPLPPTVRKMRRQA